VPKQEK
jgi:hypothetical protein